MKKSEIHHGKMDTLALSGGQRYGIRFNSEPVTDRDQRHYHDFYEVFISISGEMKYEVEQQTFDLHAGDVLFIPPCTEHRPVQSGLSGSTRCILQLEKTLPEEILSGSLQNCFSMPLHFKLNTASLSHIINLMQYLLEEQPSGELCHSLLEHAILTQILVLLVRNCNDTEAKEALFPESPPGSTGSAISVFSGSDASASSGSNASTGSDASASADSPFGVHTQASRQRRTQIQSAAIQLSYYIDTHFTQDISLQSLSGRLGVDRTRLSREFRQIYGQSPHEYLMNRRLSIAYETILAGTPPTLAAAQSGFHDYSNFYRQFLRRYGIAPRQCSQETRIF